MRTRDTDIVIIPGLGGSGPDHWQSRWQAKLPNAHRVEQADWDRPNEAAWVSTIIERIQRCERPVVVVAHSLGVTSLVRAAEQGLPPIAGAFLVAPPADGTIRSQGSIDPAFAPTPRPALSFPSVTVGSRTDPYATIEQTEEFAAAWGSTFIDAGEAGHLNVESGHGPWPEGLMSFAGFLSKLPSE